MLRVHRARPARNARRDQNRPFLPGLAHSSGKPFLFFGGSRRSTVGLGTSFPHPWHTQPRRPVHTRNVEQCGHLISLFSVAPHCAQLRRYRVPLRFHPTRAPQIGHSFGSFRGARLSTRDRCLGISSGASHVIAHHHTNPISLAARPSPRYAPTPSMRRTKPQ